MRRSSKTPKGGDWVHRLLDTLIDATDDVTELELITKPVRKSELTDKYLYLLIAISNGLTFEQIADHIEEPLETVSDRFKQCVRYLEAKNRTHAIAIAIRQNLI